LHVGLLCLSAFLGACWWKKAQAPCSAKLQSSHTVNVADVLEDDQGAGDTPEEKAALKLADQSTWSITNLSYKECAEKKPGACTGTLTESTARGSGAVKWFPLTVKRDTIYEMYLRLEGKPKQGSGQSTTTKCRTGTFFICAEGVACLPANEQLDFSLSTAIAIDLHRMAVYKGSTDPFVRPNDLGTTWDDFRMCDRDKSGKPRWWFAFRLKWPSSRDDQCPAQPLPSLRK